MFTEHERTAFYGVLNFKGVAVKVLGVNSACEPPSSESSWRRRFGVQELSIASGSFWDMDAVSSQYCVKYVLNTSAEFPAVNLVDPLMAR